MKRLPVPDHEVLFGTSLGQWNGADAADAAGRVRLATQADRDGLDLFTVAGFIYRNADEETPDDVALARWVTEIVPAVRAAITR